MLFFYALNSYTHGKQSKKLYPTEQDRLKTQPIQAIKRSQTDKPLTTTTLNDLCRIFNCSIEDIAIYVPSIDDQTLI